MSKQAFTVEGDFEMGRIRQHFRKEVVAADEAAAKEATYAELGSRHGVVRRQIDITSVSPLDLENASNITQHKVQRE